MTTKRDTSTKAEHNSRQDCACCLPFSGLGDGKQLLERLKVCGALLLEQAAPTQTVLVEPLTRS